MKEITLSVYTKTYDLMSKWKFIELGFDDVT